ncbi:hypothetical protein B5V00_01625 [Geothermobacter hydrogeniphilus]|uniref:LysM domain-containing protein n=1 Tax=Geothermobacter hydrogeniphilus TaxID=1969733 RepID=A0A1X0YF36_9BACT|nr:hypothetical protein B5V00_01625 [Geothermobacter hydrogeniphilus]
MNLTRGCCIVLLLGSLWGCSPPRGVYHAVQPGQTLYQISRTYGVEESYLARVNRISDPTRLAVGQRVFIPGATSVKHVPATVSLSRKAVSSGKPTRKRPAAAPGTGSGRQGKKPASVKSRKPATKSHHPQQDAGRTKTTGTPPPVRKGHFLWPARGRILKPFGGQGKNAGNGIEIAVRKGSPVHSAAAGKVIYSGNGISGYGNLIILQHDDSFYTVYGFNSKNLVEAGGFVSKGQKIALSGVPPSGGSPRLYFEVRYGKRPVNPIFYLP